MEPIAVVTVLAVFQVFSFAYLVGKQRAKHGVRAPAITAKQNSSAPFAFTRTALSKWLFSSPHYGCLDTTCMP